jgi:hypothetical protein
MSSFRPSERFEQLPVHAINREAVEVYFTSDPLAFMNARFISGIAMIRRAGKVGP